MVDQVDEVAVDLPRRADPDLPPAPGAYWTRVLEGVHEGLNGC
ncbi:hypothetical protein [Kitasatospora phosalacinea]|nr:hypothetical protein [Kitasatospora phosalacinea]